MDPLTAALTIGSTVLQASSARSQGIATQQAKNYEAQQLEVNAGQERAASQRVAQEERRRAALAQSRGLAVAAGSGGGASDASVVDLLSDLEQEGEYSALNALYEGEERARGNESAASTARYEGKQAKRAGNLAALGAVAGTAIDLGGSSLIGKYGGSSVVGKEIPVNVGGKAGYYDPKTKITFNQNRGSYR